jgi:acyl-CoA synthetase (AMP-forming)/AMP-acid ligase II
LPKLKHQIVIGDEDAHLCFEKLVAVAPSHEPRHLIEDRDPVSYLYTSGTTSAPKGVASSHLAIYVAALSMALETKLSSGDQVLAMLPLFHTTPLNTLCTPAIAAGATIHIRKGFEAEPVLDLFERERISVLVALPIMYRALLELQLIAPRDVSGLRLALYGMAPMPRPELERLIETFDCDFALVFGQTEMSPVTTMFRPEHQLTHSGAAGTPLANVEVGIMDSQGELLPQGTVGEIVYRGPQVLNGYLHDEAATAEAFRFGWFHSGDAGYFDPDGLLWFQDRIKDVIKSGGENVASVEVEQALYNAEPRLREVVVIGLPHDRWGEAVTAIAVKKDGELLDEQDILKKLRDRLAAHKCPKAIIFTDTLPKTATAKVQKVELRKRFQDYYRGATS